MKKKKWMQLDNAAKIYPAAKKRGWMALFRLSMDLREDIDPDVLSQALSNTLKRYPTFEVRIRKGLFWFYLEHNSEIPTVLPDVCCPCPYLNQSFNKNFSFRVRYYKKRIAVEFYHILTDGTGGMHFLKTLTAEYLRIKKGLSVSKKNILLCGEKPDNTEVEDSFKTYVSDYSIGRQEPDSYKISGKHERDGFVNLTCGILDASEVIAKAKEKNVTVTEYLTSAMILAIMRIQESEVKRKRKHKHVKVCIPINLRRFFPSKTVRNFASYVNPGIDPRTGEFTFDDILKSVHHQMGLEVTPQNLGAKFTANVRSERNPILRIFPLFMKNIAMKIAYRMVGDRKSSTIISNLGIVDLPDEMKEEVTRADFMIGPLFENPLACGVLSYNGRLHFNMTRTIREPKVEKEFFSVLLKLGLKVQAESNYDSKPIH